MSDDDLTIRFTDAIYARVEQQNAEKPERFVTSDDEAMHAARIRGLCDALNAAVREAARDGLKVEYTGSYGDGWTPWSSRGDDTPPLVLTPTILRKL